MYNTGAWGSEAIGLRNQDIVIADGSAAVHLLGKGGKHRSVPLWKPTIVLLPNWIKPLSSPGAAARPEIRVEQGLACVVGDVLEHLQIAIQIAVGQSGDDDVADTAMIEAGDLPFGDLDRDRSLKPPG